MKKNILLVQSLVTLAAFSSTQIFSSENTPLIPKGFVERQDSQPLNKTKKKNRRKAAQPATLSQSAEIAKPTTVEQPKDEVVVIAEPIITAVAIDLPKEPTIDTAPAPITTELAATVEKDVITANILAVETTTSEKIIEAAPATEVVTETAPSKIPTDDTIRKNFASMIAAINEKAKAAEAKATEDAVLTMDQLSVSHYQPVPTIKQGLSWSDWAKSKVSSQWFALDAIKAKTFDPQNADHMNGLMAAAEKLVLTGDSEKLQELLNACRENYPNIELKRKIALQVKERFKSDEKITTQEYSTNVSAETTKLMLARKVILDKTAELVTALAKQIEDNGNELALLEADYASAIHQITQAHNKKAAAAQNGKNTLYKLRRDIQTNNSTKFDHNSAEYLALKTKNAATIETAHQDINQSLNNITAAQNAVKATLSILAIAEKPSDLQIVDKK